jgi:hypothetical protein
VSDDWYRDDGDQRCPCCGGSTWGQTPAGVIECTNCWWNESTPAAIYRRRAVLVRPPEPAPGQEG